MKFSLATIVSLAAFTQLASANFDLYATQLFSPTGDVLEGWAIFATDPNCAQATSAKHYGSVGDVSGNKLGVRCKGSCNMYGDVNNIDEVEMHFNNNPLFHWTIYKNRGHPYKMYGLDGKVYGECIKFPSVSYSCPSFGLVQGHRKFRCLIKYDAHTIQWG